MSNLPDRQGRLDEGWPCLAVSNPLVTGKTEMMPGSRFGASLLLAPETLRLSFGVSRVGRGS